MNPSPASTVAEIAALLSADARASIMWEFISGVAFTATELATRANIAPSTASEHLAVLETNGLIGVERHGKHRYFRIVEPSVAELVESMSTWNCHRPPQSSPVREIPHGWLYARTCYDHLAGYLGVELRQALLDQSYLESAGAEHVATLAGVPMFSELGIDIEPLKANNRSFSRSCLDWSERRHHLAGALGAAMLHRFLQLGWLVRIPGERELVVSESGRASFDRIFNIQVPKESVRH